MGDEQESAAEIGMKPMQFILHGMAKLQVERRQRFVKKKNLGAHDQGSRQRHPLLLPARQEGWVSVGKIREPGKARRIRNTIINLAARRLAQPQTIADILAHGHVRKETVALEHRVRGPRFRTQLRHVAPVDLDRS